MRRPRKIGQALAPAPVIEKVAKPDNVNRPVVRDRFGNVIGTNVRFTPAQNRIPGVTVPIDRGDPLCTYCMDLGSILTVNAHGEEQRQPCPGVGCEAREIAYRNVTPPAPSITDPDCPRGNVNCTIRACTARGTCGLHPMRGMGREYGDETTNGCGWCAAGRCLIHGVG